MLTQRHKKTLSYAIKIAIALLAFWFAFSKIIQNKDLANFTDIIGQIPLKEMILVMTVVITLMFLNWGFEVLKWQRVLRNVERISTWRAVESVFCGLTMAIFTPNRVGEYGGRVFFLSPKRRIVGLVAMLVGNLGQLLLTNVFGSIAACIFVYRFKSLDPWILYILVFLAICFCIFMILFYFNIQWIKGLLLAIKWTRKYERFYGILGRYKKLELLELLLYSLARYVIFSTQYLILLSWLTPELQLQDMVLMLCIIFFVQSSVPSLNILDIGVRSLTATYFFGFITNNSVSVIAATACVWFVNIIIPAILGVWFVFKLNFFGNPKRN